MHGNRESPPVSPQDGSGERSGKAAGRTPDVYAGGQSRNVLDLWADHWRKHRATGDVIIVRYADDFVVGFQHRGEAERFLRELKPASSRMP